MRLPEVHIWRDKYGRPARCEFRNGEQRMEVRATRLVITEDPSNLLRVELTFLAKPIYHDDDKGAA